MASIVSSTIFYATFMETIDINGVKQQATRRHLESSVTDYSHRILTLKATDAITTITLLTLGSNNAGGQVSADDVAYVRVSNLDDETSIRLVVNTVTAGPTNAGSFHIEILPLKSHIVCTKQAAMVAANAAFTAYATIDKIQAVLAANATVDVELFLVSK